MAISPAPANKPCPINKPKAHPGMQLGKELNLTQEQQQKAAEMREKSRTAIKPLVDQLKDERQKLKELKEKNAPEQEIKAQQQKVMELMSKVKAVHEQNLSGFEGILTPEQKTKFQEIKKEKHEKMQEKRQERMNNMKNKGFGNFEKHRNMQ
ncbi:MAG: Spy/CpxP family protein refolding chaperone [Candidatus Moduliflexus flocculans]|nr:Spy/CpxP family protein refolding chaperone [Candidatus Moduliflexus flocculans]